MAMIQFIDNQHLVSACQTCPHASSGFDGVVGCSVLGRSVFEDLARNEPFCPIGRHRGLSVSRWVARVRVQLTTIRVRLRRVVNGMDGLAAWWNHWSPVDESNIKFRGTVCATCPHRRQWSAFDICGICRCWLYAKIRVGWEQCPRGRWAALEKRPGALSLPVVRGGCGGCQSK